MTEEIIKVEIEEKILAANDRIAEENRKLFLENKVFVINLMSSPGAGKTTLLEETGKALKSMLNIGAIEGDIQSTIDAERVQEAGIKAVQIETHGACHLDASMIRSSLDRIQLLNLDLLIVENVGNLVCPAEFNIGEHAKVMMLSVTEGDDKPLKYPLMFKESSLLLISKVDLLPYLRCNIENLKKAALAINPAIKIIELSSYSGAGISEWIEWLTGQIQNAYS